MKKASKRQKYEILGSFLILAVFVLPFFSFAGNRKDIYVDQDAHGREDGSESHPYHTLEKAMKHANNRTDIHVAEGEYYENITIPEGANLYGDNTDDVIIHGDSSHKPVVTLKDGSEINKVTIKKGEDGILVKEHASRVSIIKVVIKDNDGDGIKIEDGPVKNREKVSVVNCTIINNGGDGIDSEERRLVLMDNEISGNGGDGISIEGGSSAWIEDNHIRNNDNGMTLTLDGSSIYTRDNTFRNNSDNGIEVQSFGGEGRIDIDDAKITNNEKYGIARIQRAGSERVWNGLTIQNNSDFEINKQGDVSKILFL